jgi:hypothetical protein
VAQSAKASIQSNCFRLLFKVFLLCPLSSTHDSPDEATLSLTCKVGSRLRFY